MYLKELKIWNFRKYGTDVNDSNKPGIIVRFNKNFNLLIGENDAGKSAIIDAIKLTLGTTSDDNLRINDKDFYVNTMGMPSDYIKIECIFSGLKEEEAGSYLEWLSFDCKGEYELQIRLIALKKPSELGRAERIEKNITAGSENVAGRLEGIARELLKTTYLKPLRDAENELKPGLKSRLAQILRNHQAFRKADPSQDHSLESTFKNANDAVEQFFSTSYSKEHPDKTIKNQLENYLDEFFHIRIENEKKYNANFTVSPVKINEILRKLSLSLDEVPSGLGSLNLLFIAAELLLHEEVSIFGPNITLIEEIEAHLHPQAQLRLIKYLQKVLEEDEETGGQFFLTTHSTSLASSTQLEHIILLYDNMAYPMDEKNTNLDKYDYEFLERFLDSTKANLFFAKGVIFVEGDAENLLLPIIADLIDRPLHRYGVSIVNIGNTAFKRYAKIFSRSDEWLLEFPESELCIPVSIVTDVDVRPMAYYEDKDNSTTKKKIYMIKQSDLEFIANKLNTEQSELDIFVGKVYEKKSTLKEQLLEYKSDISDIDMEAILSKTDTEVDEGTLNSLRELRIQNITEEYEKLKGNIKTYIAPHWTLEYEIALSDLRNSLLEAMHKVRYKNPDSEVNKSKLEKLKEKIEAISDDEMRAFKVYKPLLEKTLSKAATAQMLARIIKHNDSLKETLLTDGYLSYLRDAIYHVTERENTNGDN